MALQEFTVSQNTGFVEQATGDMGAGQLDDIEHRAKAQVTTAQVETSRAASAEKEASGAAPKSGNAETSVYGSLLSAAVLPGAEGLSNVAEFLDQRYTDKSFTGGPQKGKTDGIMGATAKTMDEHIASGINRKPGLYEDAPTKPSVYGGGAKKKGAGEDVFAMASIAASSLLGQPKATFEGMEVKSGKVSSATEGLKKTFGLELSNQKSLESVLAARQQHGAVMYQVNQLSPGLGMASGPSIRPQELLKEARQENDDRWRTSST